MKEKKMGHGMPHELIDRARDRWHSLLKKLSRGAAERSCMRTWAHGDGWRRKDKSQPGHDKHPHKCHKDR